MRKAPTHVRSGSDRAPSWARSEVTASPRPHCRRVGRFLRSRRGAVRAVFALVDALDVNIVAWVVSVNTALEVLFGHLFWRYGLEAAMIAHGVAYLVNYLLNP